MSRSTKLVVILSNLAAIWLIAELTSRVIGGILIPTIIIFLLSWLSAVWLGDVVTSIVLSTLYLVPAACFLWFGRFTYWDYALWLGGLSGSMLPRALGSRWALPHRFNAPVAFWALVLALSWPIMVLREVDFVPAMLSRTGIPARLPQSPTVTAVWIATVASIAMTGLLLIDWLFLPDAADRLKRFESRVIWPLCAGAALAAAVATYQSTVDISFLSYTFFRYVDRAVGTTADANAFGSAMALWVPVAAAMATRATDRRWMAMWVVLVLILGIAVWGSGSRTAILAALIGLAVLSARVLRSFKTRRALLTALGVMVLGASIAWMVPSTAVSRTKGMLASFSQYGVRYALWQLWSRDMYGTAAEHMIAHHPFVGVGVGGFNYQYGDVLYLFNRTSRPPDNAQNWFRQQLAELGVVGSLGWIAWTCLFGWILLKPPPTTEDRVVAAAVKGAILGLAAASLLGMPTQDTAVSISLVVFMAWYMKLSALPGSAADERPRRAARLEWAAMLTLLACFLFGSIYEARTDMRRPIRALRVNAPYTYGLVPDASDPSIRWTGKKAVDVFQADKNWLKIVIGDVAPDAAAKPVLVVVRLNRDIILRVRRQGNFPITRWVRMPAAGTLLMLEIDVDRTWRPSDFGNAADTRERGVALREWSFSFDDPPKGSVTIETPPAPLP